MYKTGILCDNSPIIKYYNNNSNFTILLIGGTHGDEPSGLLSLTNYNLSNIKHVNIITCFPNMCGIYANTRNDPTTNNDINRHYNSNNPHNLIIEDLCHKSNLVIDFHEGYDFHIRNKNSIGSTLTSKKEIDLCNLIVSNLNNFITDHYKKFVFINQLIPKIPGSLQSYCNLYDISYILVETTRIEHINQRIQKCNIILDTIFKNINHNPLPHILSHSPY